MHVVYGVIKQEDGKKEKGYHTVGEGISDSNPEAKDYKLLGQPLRYLLQIFNTTFITTYLPFEFLHTFIYIYSHAWDCSSPSLNGCCDLCCGWLELIASFSFSFPNHLINGYCLFYHVRKFENSYCTQSTLYNLAR